MEEIKMEREFGLKSCLRRKGNKTFGLDYRADITQYNYYGIFKNKFSACRFILYLKLLSA